MSSWFETVSVVRPRALLVAAALGGLIVGGCQKPAEKAPEAEPTAEAPPASPAPAEPAAAEPAPATAQTYAIKITPGDAEAGKPATSVIEVTPMPGYKMNKDFPTRLAVSPSEGVTLAKSDFEKDDVELSEEVLRFEVPFTAAAAGKLDLAGSADFSVCNENACKLIRDEKLAWQVAVR